LAIKYLKRYFYKIKKFIITIKYSNI